MVDAVVRDASAKAVGPATRNPREEVFLSSPPRKRGSSATVTACALDSCFRRNDGWADHRRLAALAGAEEVDRPLFRPGASFCGKFLARSAATRIKALPPSVTRQHCNNPNGQAIIPSSAHPRP